MTDGFIIWSVSHVQYFMCLFCGRSMCQAACQCLCGSECECTQYCLGADHQGIGVQGQCGSQPRGSSKGTVRSGCVACSTPTRVQDLLCYEFITFNYSKSVQRILHHTIGGILSRITGNSPPLCCEHGRCLGLIALSKGDSRVAG